MNKKPRIRSETRTIMFLDMVGYTRRTRFLNRENIELLQETLDALIVPLIEEYHGSVIKKMGDGFLASFKSANDTLLCASHVQEKVKLHNQGKKSKEKVGIKIGIHTGEVVIKRGDLYGDAVNIASRIQGKAKAGQILFSRVTYLAMNKNEISTVTVGTRKIKGVNRPIRLFQVKTKRQKKFISWKKKTAQKIRSLVWITIIIAIIVAGILAVRYLLRGF